MYCSYKQNPVIPAKTRPIFHSGVELKEVAGPPPKAEADPPLNPTGFLPSVDLFAVPRTYARDRR